MVKHISNKLLGVCLCQLFGAAVVASAVPGGGDTHSVSKSELLTRVPIPTPQTDRRNQAPQQATEDPVERGSRLGLGNWDWEMIAVKQKPKFVSCRTMSVAITSWDLRWFPKVLTAISFLIENQPKTKPSPVRIPLDLADGWNWFVLCGKKFGEDV